MTQKNAKKSAARARKAEHGGKYQAPLRIVGGGAGNSPKPWSCTTCKKPIVAGEGYIVVMDAETGDYPVEPSPDGTFLTPVRIQFGAYHRECDPNPATEPYWFHV